MSALNIPIVAPELQRLNARRRWSPSTESAWSPTEYSLRQVTTDRDRLAEQLDHVSALSSRLIDEVDARDAKIGVLEAEGRQQGALVAALEQETVHLIRVIANQREQVAVLEQENEHLIQVVSRRGEQVAELEAENDQLVRHLGRREDRITALESFLDMLATAERRG